MTMLPCPFCKNTKISVGPRGLLYRCRCSKCGMQGPVGKMDYDYSKPGWNIQAVADDAMDLAIANWNGLPR